MAYPPRQTDAEGDTVGATPSGFDNMAGAPVVSTTQALVGTKSIKFQDAVTFQTCRFQNFGQLKVPVWAMAFLWLPSVPTGADLTAIQINSFVGGGIGKFMPLTTGKAQIHTGSFATAGTINLPITAWFRAEVRCTPGVDSELRWWSSPFSTGTPDETLVTQNIATEIDGVDFGSCGGVFPTTPYTFYEQRPAISMEGWIGPGKLPPGIKPSYSDFPRPIR